MAPVGQKLWPAMGVLAASSVQLGYGYRYTASCSDPKESSRRRGRKNNYALPAPGSAASLGRRTNRVDRAARNIDGLELAIGKETDGAAVGRPEWKNGALCPGQDLAGSGHSAAAHTICRDFLEQLR